MKKLFILFAALAFVLSASAQTATPKFYMNVTGHNGATPVTVDMSVYSDFHFVVNLPAAANSTLGANTATVRVEMHDVSSLDVVGTKIYNNTITTGVEGIQADLSQKLSNAYGFTSVTIPVTINTKDDSKTFSYTIAKSGDVITGTPSASAAARAAWDLLMTKVDAGSQDESDAYMLFKKGSTFVLGNERLTFIGDYAFLQGSTSNYEDLLTNDSVVIETLAGADPKTIEFYFAKGSVLALGRTTATVKDVINISAKGNVNITSNYFSGVKSAINSAADGTKTKVAIHKFMDFFNDLIGIAQQGGTIDANGKEIELGDVNEDGVVDATDLSALKQYIMTGTLPAVYNFWAADASYAELDGIYDVTDLSAIQQIIFGQTTNTNNN